MANRQGSQVEITPEVLLKAYACGIFPMAESAEDPALYWIEPERRGILPIERFHVPARLIRTVRADRFRVVCDRDFDAVIDGCAEPKPGRARTWINARIRKLYRALFERGHCHTVEVYDGEALVAKIALVHLVARLRAGGFVLLDTQFVTDHLEMFGAVELSRRQYHRLLEQALTGEGRFDALAPQRPISGREALLPLLRRRARRHSGSSRRGRWRRQRRHAIFFAVDEPHIVDRMLDPVEPGARGKHPAAEDALGLALQRDLIDLDEAVGIGRFGRRTRVADPRRNLQGAELHSFVDSDVERDDAAGDLVEAGEYRGGVEDFLGGKRRDHFVARLRRGSAGLRGAARRRLALARRHAG